MLRCPPPLRILSRDRQDFFSGKLTPMENRRLIIRSRLSLAPPEGMQQLSEVATRDFLVDSESLRFVVGAAVGAEREVHQRGNVSVVSSVARTVMMPVVKLRRTDEPFQRADIQSDV